MVELDVDAASELLQRRHDAARSAASVVDPPAPARHDDPFPDERSLPEIAVAQLTPDVVGGAIEHHGSLLVRGLLSRGGATSLRERVERSIDARDRVDEGAPEPDDADWYRRFTSGGFATAFERKWVKTNGGMLLVDAPRVFWEVMDEYQRVGITDVVAALLGERLAVASQKCVLRKMWGQANPTWHQDGSFMGVSALNVWLSLSDCGGGTDAPGLDIVPMRVDRILDTRTHDADYAIAIGQGLVDEVRGDVPWVTPRFEPGDALIFDERLVHRSAGAGDDAVTRYAVETWFFSAASVPDDYAPIIIRG